MQTDGDWRLTVRFCSVHQHAAVLDGLSVRAAAALAEKRVTQLVSVQRDGTWLRLYAHSYQSLARSHEAIFSALTELNEAAEERVERLDPDSGQWTQAEVPLISEIQAERISSHHSEGSWGSQPEPDRVTIQLRFSARREAIAAAQRLAEEGYDAHRHWTSVYLFAEDRDSAEALVDGLKAHVPDPEQVFYMGEGNTFFP
jgi:hypothetical protein